MANEREDLKKAVAEFQKDDIWYSPRLIALIRTADDYLKATEPPKTRWLDADPADCNDPGPISFANQPSDIYAKVAADIFSIDRAKLEEAIDSYSLGFNNADELRLILAAARKHLAAGWRVLNVLRVGRQLSYNL